MKTTTLLLPILLLGVLLSCDPPPTAEKNVEVEKTTMIEKAVEKVVRHMVLFKFKDESSKADVDKINDAFLALPAAIPVVKDFEWGINHSPEGLDQGFTHCYFVTFANEMDRDSVYAPHPAHQAFVAGLQPHLDKVLVVDYWTNP